MICEKKSPKFGPVKKVLSLVLLARFWEDRTSQGHFWWSGSSLKLHPQLALANTESWIVESGICMSEGTESNSTFLFKLDLCLVSFPKFETETTPFVLKRLLFVIFALLLFKYPVQNAFTCPLVEHQNFVCNDVLHLLFRQAVHCDPVWSIVERLVTQTPTWILLHMSPLPLHHYVFNQQRLLSFKCFKLCSLCSYQRLLGFQLHELTFKTASVKSLMWALFSHLTSQVSVCFCLPTLLL